MLEGDGSFRRGEPDLLGVSGDPSLTCKAGVAGPFRRGGLDLLEVLGVLLTLMYTMITLVYL